MTNHEFVKILFFTLVTLGDLNPYVFALFKKKIGE